MSCRPIALLSLLVPAAAFAGPPDYVFMPLVEYGERELDLRIGTESKSGEGRFSGAGISFGYGFTEHWFSEISLKYEKQSPESLRFDAFEWENRFQLTEQGRWPIDVGFVIELERPRDCAEGYELRLGPLFQTDYERWQVNANFLLERHYRSEAPEATELGYQWQVRYLATGAIDAGAQGFGSVGTWNHWNPKHGQEHLAGPAVFGKWNLGGRNIINYNAALLFGLTSGSPDRRLRAQIEYEF